jgi:hypothetical protein
MKLRFLLFLTLFAAVGLIPVACISDAVSTSSSDVLTFSTDTVCFDTVFTDLGTPTARLQVYNRNKKGVNISSISLKDPSSRFRINVDGQSGDSFKDIEIRGNDSIYLFIECYIPESEGSEPKLVSDELQFVTNGVTQEVRLEAYGQNVVRLRNERITADSRFTADRPYVVFDSLVVDPGVTLSIDPGAKILFHDKASLVVHGKLDAVGTAENKIAMRGDRLDDVLPDVAYDVLAGQWKGIRFTAESFDNRMEYVNMRSTESGVTIDSCANIDQTKLTLVNSWLHNSQGSVLKSEYAKVNAYGCCFSEAAEAVVSLTGGSHEFVQCTIANYYLYSIISEPLLSLYHCLPANSEENELPLMQASFDNCIIYGRASDINEGDLTGSSVYLRNVMLKSDGEDDDNFIDCLWGQEPLFQTIYEDYYFNYRLKDDSPAIGAGNPNYVNTWTLYDMDGLNRLANGNPDLGSYVYKSFSE